MDEKEYKLNLRNDYVFKMLMYRDAEKGKEIFINLIEALTRIKATGVRFEPTELYSFDPRGKDVRFDVNATLNTEHSVDLEMQIHHLEAVADRLNFYTAMLYVTQNNKGKDYDEFINVQCIFLCSNDVFQNKEKYLHEFMMKDEPEAILTEKMKAYIIEMNKGLRRIEEKQDINELTMREKWIFDARIKNGHSKQIV